jgi:hypothetical protein
MASEIRANKQTNRVGLGTVTYTNTGIIVSGIVTANSISGGSSVTATTFYGSGSNLTGIDATALKDPNGVVKVQAQVSGAVHSGISTFSTIHSSNLVSNNADIDDFISVGTNIHLGNAGVVTATSFKGDGSQLSNLPAGAPVGGASTNTVFFENDTAVAVNYQITSGKNAMSAGPIAINAGIAVTVPSGSSWTIV